MEKNVNIRYIQLGEINPIVLDFPAQNTFFTSSTSSDEMKYIIQDLKTNETTGPNN